MLRYLLPLLLLGCASQQNFHLLQLQPPAAATAKASAASYGLRKVNLPDYLGEETIIGRGSDGAILKFKEDKWLETPDLAIPAALYQQLERLSNSAHFYRYPLSANVVPERVIDVDIEQLLADLPAGVVHVRASWQVAGQEEHNPPRRRFSRTVPLSGSSPSAIVKGQQQALEALASAIAASL